MPSGASKKQPSTSTKKVVTEKQNDRFDSLQWIESHPPIKRVVVEDVKEQVPIIPLTKPVPETHQKPEDTTPSEKTTLKSKKEIKKTLLRNPLLRFK